MQFHDSHYIGLKVSLSEPNKKSKEPEMLKKNKKNRTQRESFFLQH